jgi:D-alanyl-lipoteichoic acid acyltransferase DltB (MBOAT superfamily)
MFYPQLVAGPIERPQNILWQFHRRQEYDFEKMKSGLMQMAFGLFKKVVIADRIAEIVDHAYANPSDQNGKTLLIVSMLYSFQIYCDFSGYSDIGIGAARTMGFKLVDNFNVPYISASLGEFWRKWHMSLSTWFRDYLYIPLGGSRIGKIRKWVNLFIVFLISGLWHGANLTFVIWGTIHGILLILEDMFKTFLGKFKRKFQNTALTRILRNIVVFLIISLTWIFFRSPDLSTAILIIKKIFSGSMFADFNYTLANKSVLTFSFFLVLILMIKERYLLTIPTKNTSRFYLNFSLMLLACYFLGVFNNKQFIYFQF